ncbi:conserved hypothetical protein [Leishmania infantum JPCM5]|uniref:Uncharacterized protein n=2 Tax=Leishmania infantum TaxID=5671 RepID=A4I8Y4_LEIIN|nr:conserved hypothetical protein [Leishmania infantum JPCM5]CAC9531507.1 hypothetical_protein_-_conserved [Leishmania infantum]CAM71284.1 conserved hypothetical protein [Leishmania infantum JPCM5]SUZ45128.1 hypothetical_protein_-_conserved [Leishmania infantum]|eukprot:XP_001468203.1 conserved hypothetical protein [Leishmania infantum JPCM5]
MSDSGSVARYPLVRVRGGAAMLFTALVSSLPPPAQVALRRVLLVIPVMAVAKVQRAAALMFTRRVLLPLLTDAFPAVCGALEGVKLNSSSATLIAALSRAVIAYSLAAKLMKADQAASLAFTTGTAACLFSEEEHLRRLLGAVVDAEASSLPSALLSAPRPAPTAAAPRMCSAFFSTTTPVALKAYLRHVHARPRASHVTIFVPGLLTAPWTTHLIPLLRDLFCHQGTTVLGYDICADAEHYDVDLRHLHDRIRQERRSTADSSALPPASSAASPFGVLVLASIRGRRVRNGDKACVFAKMHGWQVVELCVPTLPLDAVHDLNPQCRPQWVRARQVQCATSSVRPDVRLTAFDDAGMYGGAVVELCNDDNALLLHMKSQCQPGLVVSSVDGTAGQAKARNSPRPAAAVTPRTLPSSAVNATLDAASGTSEFISKVCCPWARRLCAAAWREACTLHQGSVTAQEAVAALCRFPLQTFPKVPLRAQAQLRRLLSPRRGSVTTTGDDSASGSASHHVSANTPVEQRTTYITTPLAAVSLLAAPQPHTASPVGTDSDRGGEGYLTVEKTTSPARAAAAALTAPEEALTNWAVERRIRLRWSSLLMSLTFAAGGAPRVAGDAAAAVRTSAAYLSLWSFVAQLPPWVVAVSAADDGETARGERRSSCCVEAFATALLVRVASPASPRAVAELLRDEALVDAAAVRPRAWDSLATTPNSAGEEALKFEDAVVFPGCDRATRLSEELLYLPLSPELPVSVRAAMLRVLWNEVPHAGDAASASVHSSWLERSKATGALSAHVQATVNSIYQMYLPQAQRGRDGKALSSATSAGNTLLSVIARGHSGGSVVSAQDAEKVQQFLFDGVTTPSVAPSLSAGAALKSLVQTLTPAVMSNL